MAATSSFSICRSTSRCVRARGESSRNNIAAVCTPPQQRAWAQSTPCNIQSALPVQRRALGALLLSPILLGAEGLVQGATAATTDFEDKQDGFTLAVPKDWTYAVPQQPYDRFRAGVSTTRTMAWFPESGTDVNVSIVITTPGADYTSLASFGSATDFGANLVASMDRSFMRGKGRPTEEEEGLPTDQVQVARLVAAASDGTAYGIEYTIQKGEEEQKHLYSRVIMGSNGRFRRFYTITATCPESKLGEVGGTLKATVASLKVENVA